jgi:D-alanyl-D-alanine carboxypeptidase (penicillin-binding protein 5/6)
MKRWILVLMIAAIAAPLAAQNEEGTGTAKGVSVDTTGKGYSAAIVMEPNTKRVLFEENADIPLPTASMAKMMTLLIAMEEHATGNLAMDAPVTISARASRMGGSQVYLKAGTVWPVKNLIIATMVHSANDAAQALAEKISGSSEGFVDLMNDRAKALGLTNSQFHDPHGLPNSEDPTRINMMSARDLAILGVELMKHPFMRQLAVIPEMPFKNGTLEMIYNPNHLVNPKRPDYFDAATGIKTGYSGPAGYCVTASAKRNNMELVAVVMGAKPPRGPMSSFGLARKLFNEAFNNYRMVTPLKKDAVVGQANVGDGAQKTVQAIAATDASALVKRGEEKNVKVNFAPQAVTAPIRAGQPVGTIVIENGDEQLAKIPAVAATNVDKQAWWKKFLPF